MDIESPITNRMLNKLDPITFPKARSLLPFFAETTEVMSSGSEVPRATTVRPMSDSLIPIPCAMSFAQ